MTNQTNEAAERSAHVTRGEKPAPAEWPVVRMPDGTWKLKSLVALESRVAQLEAQNDMLRHATDKLRAMLAELNARHEPLQRAFITAVELLNDAALEGEKKDE